jgi:hypothetical protein
MSITWKYPLYVIPHGMGYVSLVEPRDGPSEEPPEQLLVVHTEAEAAQALMEQFGLQGSPRELANAREFCWLLRNLRVPTTQVAFDPRPHEAEVNSRWAVAVRQLLDEFLKVDYSPWNYPVFAIQQDDGFASIQSQSASEPQTAVGLFTRIERAEQYLRESEETGDVHELADMDAARFFLESLSHQITAVALDPSVSEGRRTAKHCFGLRTLLDKYLVFET